MIEWGIHDEKTGPAPTKPHAKKDLSPGYCHSVGVVRAWLCAPPTGQPANAGTLSSVQCSNVPPPATPCAVPAAMHGFGSVTELFDISATRTVVVDLQPFLPHRHHVIKEGLPISTAYGFIPKVTRSTLTACLKLRILFLRPRNLILVQ